MRYPREFFAIRLEFAQKMTELVQGRYLDIVLHKTAFYRILGMDWSLLQLIDSFGIHCMFVCCNDSGSHGMRSHQGFEKNIWRLSITCATQMEL